MNPAAKHPVSYRLIDKDDLDSIQWALAELGLCELGLCQASCHVDSVSRAGEGNMNVVLRVIVGQQSFILKQSQPWVAKYPTIAAPEERLLAEIDFYDRVAGRSDPLASQDLPVARWMPRLLARSVAHRMLAMEDLGDAGEYTTLYDRGAHDDAKSESVFFDAIGWLASLHQVPIDEAKDQSFGCIELRRLNHEHIFDIPMMEPAAFALDDVCAGLDQASRIIRTDQSVRAAMSKLGAIYLSGESEEGAVRRLLHGDYYPGSWLQTDAGFRVIDPEFCFAGPPEFDLGVLTAHRILCQSDPADDFASRTCNQYKSCGGPAVAHRLVERFAGAEILRRLLGVAQLPIVADLETRIRWLDQGRDMVLKD